MKNTFKSIFILFMVLTCAPIFAQKFEPVKEIPQGKALVYIYRPGSMVGAAVHYAVNANDEKIGEAHLRNNSYMVYFAEPGRYTFWAQVTNTRREVDLDVEAGNIYYVRGNCCEFVIPETGKAEKEITGCKLSTH